MDPITNQALDVVSRMPTAFISGREPDPADVEILKRVTMLPHDASIDEMVRNVIERARVQRSAARAARAK